MCYQGNKGSVWSYMNISHLFLVLVLWNKLLSWIRAQQLVGDLLTRDLFVSTNSVQPTTGSGYIVSALAIAIAVAMSLETAAAVQASLLLRCGDIETNPGPLTREGIDLETVDNSYVLSKDDMRDVRQEVVDIKANYYQFGIALGLPVGELDSIHRAFHQVIDHAFDQVLLLWLRQRYDFERHGRPTWRRLVEEVERFNPTLAADIANRHPISGIAESVSHPSGHSAPTVQDHNTRQQVSGHRTLNTGATNYNVRPPTAPTSRYRHGQVPPSYNQQPPAVRNYAGNLHRVPNSFPPTRAPPPRVSPIPYSNPPPPQPHPSSTYWTDPSGHSGSASQQPTVQAHNTSFTPQQVSGYHTLNFGNTNYNVRPPTTPTPHYIRGQIQPSYSRQPTAVRNYAGMFPRVPKSFPPTRVPPPTRDPYPNPPPPQPHPSCSYWTGRASQSYQHQPPSYQPLQQPGYMVPHGIRQGVHVQFDGIQPVYKSNLTTYPKQKQDEESEVTLSSKKRKLDPSLPPLGQVPFHVNTTQRIGHWRQKLIESYLAQECSSDAWPPLKLIQFVQLALVKQDEQAHHIGLETIRKNIDEVYGKKSAIGFNEIFEKINPFSLILLEGRPGSGKTTLMVKVSCDWARGTILRSKLVILVRLRHLNKTRNVYLHDLLRVAYGAPSQEDVDGLASYIEGRLGEDVVFVLDGFDEYSPGASDDNYISKLILKQVYSRSVVIVSSRPHATQRFRQNATKWVEVMGFFKNQVIQYITSYFEKRRRKEKAQELIQHLEQHTNLMNLCYLPLHCAMLVFLYEQGNATLPVTETEFYRDFTLSILIRSCQKQSEHTNPTQKLKSFDCLPHKERNIFDKICKLAFQATISSQQVFERIALDQICSNDSLGLVVIDRYFVRYGIDETYTFLHLTLQEYLAAVHIAGLSESEQTNIVSRHCHDKHLHVTWRFLFGILDYSKESTVKLFKLILDATSVDCLLHIQCAYESQHSAACTDVLHYHKCELKFRDIGPFDLACITYVLKTAEYTTIELNFDYCNFSADDAVALLKGVGDHQLSLTVNQGKAVQSVLDVLSLVTVPGLIELDLQTLRGGVSVKSHLKLSNNLHKLCLVGIDITNSGLEEGFKHWPNLEKLLIAGTSCPLTVLEAIKHCTNLVKLTLGYNKFGDDGLQAVAEGIMNCKELKELHLQYNSLTDKSIPHLLKLIKSVRNPEKFDLRDNKFTREGVEQIKEAVRDRNSVGDMTELTLSI